MQVDVLEQFTTGRLRAVFSFPERQKMDQITSLLKSLKLEGCLLVFGIFIGSLAACAQIEKICWKKIAKELALSWVAALITYCTCRWIEANEWLMISFVSMASYSGSKTLPVFQALWQSIIKRGAEKHFDIDFPEDKP